MKNITITMDEAVADWARIEAAKRNTSVSRMVGEMVAQKMRHEDAYARAMREWAADTTHFNSSGQPYASREETYARR